MPVRPLLLHRMALVSFRLYVSEKFGQLARIFGQMVYRPRWQKISRTPMQRGTAIYLCAMQQCAIVFGHWALGVTGICNQQR